MKQYGFVMFSSFITPEYVLEILLLYFLGLLLLHFFFLHSWLSSVMCYLCNTTSSVEVSSGNLMSCRFLVLEGSLIIISQNSDLLHRAYNLCKF